MHGHLPALDGLRGVAVLMVLIRHANVPPTDDVLSMLASFFLGAGFLGVDLFFVLSGFLITGILVKARTEPHYLRSFFARRALRIWPLYYLTVLVVVFLEPFDDLIRSQGIAERAGVWLAFVQNIDQGLLGAPPTLFNNLWSVAVEEQFYLLLPFVVLLVKPRLLPWVLACAVVGGLLVRLGLFWANVNPYASYMLMPARLDSLALGGLLCVLMPRPRWRHAMTIAARPIVIISIPLLVGLGVVNYGFDMYEPAMRTWGYSVAALLFGSVLVITLTSARAAQLLSARWLRLFGKYSYAIYLLNYPVWGFVERLVGPPPTILGSRFPTQVAAWVLMCLMSLALGWLCWNVVERHALALKRFFPTASSTPLQVAPAPPAPLPAALHQTA